MVGNVIPQQKNKLRMSKFDSHLICFKMSIEAKLQLWNFLFFQNEAENIVILNVYIHILDVA